MSNTTFVVPQTELDYMVYMLTMYASPLPYLKNQTNFLRVDLNVTSYDVSCPGEDIQTESWVLHDLSQYLPTTCKQMPVATCKPNIVSVLPNAN